MTWTYFWIIYWVFSLIGGQAIRWTLCNESFKDFTLLDVFIGFAAALLPGIAFLYGVATVGGAVVLFLDSIVIMKGRG